MRLILVRRLSRLFLAVCLWSAAMSGLPASLSEQLAEYGHPNTHGCVVSDTDNGVGFLLVVQFKGRGDARENQSEVIAILKVMAEGLVSAGHRYVGFRATESEKNCLDGDPAYLYWRDYDDNWRSVSGSPRRYLTQLKKTLEPELRNSPPEAFVLHSLGTVEWRQQRERSAVRNFEQAWEILAGAGDPYGISERVLAPLVRYHLGERGDEEKGQIYLNAYAMNVESLTGLDYLPIIKTAASYPRAAMSARLEGYVLLEFRVTREGRVIDVIVVDQDPPGVFDDAAIEAVSGFRYVPRIVDGEAVDVSGVRYRIEFALR
jgi:TonB family protein